MSGAIEKYRDRTTPDKPIDNSKTIVDYIDELSMHKATREELRRDKQYHEAHAHYKNTLKTLKNITIKLENKKQTYANDDDKN